MSNPTPDPASSPRSDATQDLPSPATGGLSADSTNPSFGPLPGAGGGAEFPFLSPPQAADEIGRLGEYRVLKKLGEGGMGFVFRGEEVSLQRPVALKVMRPEVAAKPNAADRFLREGRAAAGLKSDHIITVYRADRANGVPYLAMEFLEGLPLDAWLKAQKKAVPLPHALRIVRDTLRGLAAAHEKGLIHRDIKPANLWIEKGTSRIKILDFGLTRGNSGDDQLTQEGAVVGTPAYMAPEQAAGEPVDPRADLFSVGVVFYHLLAGKNPFARGNMMQTLRAIGFETQLPVTDFRGDVPKAYADFLDRLLAKNPDHRPANAKAALHELTAIEKAQADANKTAPAGATLVAVPTDAAPQVWGDLTAEEGVQVHTTRVEHAKPAGPPTRANKKWLIGGGLVAALLVVGGLTSVLMKGGPKPKVESPEGPKDNKTVAKVEPKKADPKKPVVMDADRKAAEFVLSRGGTVVTTADRNRVIEQVQDLPAGPFELTTVDVGRGPFGDADLEFFRPLREVGTFGALRATSTLTDAGVAKLAGFPFAGKLEYLLLPGGGLTDEAFRSVAKFPALIQLYLDSKTITGSGLAHLAGTGVESLSAAGCSVTEKELVHLKALPKLRDLDLRYMSFSDAGLAHIAALKRLNSLNLWNCDKVTDGGLKRLEEMESLGTLFVSSPGLTPAALQSVAKIKGLTFFRGFPAEAGNATLTDTDLKPLADAKTLELLEVSLAAVTDAGLDTLARIKTLKALNLKGSKVTDAGLKKFRMTLPECKVESDFDGVADRRAAEFVLSRGGTVRTNADPYRPIEQVKDLPPFPFELTQISQQKNGFDDADLDAFRSLRSLEVLDTHHAKVTDAGLEKVAAYPFAGKLTALFLRSGGLTDQAFRAVAKFPALTHLAIGGAPGITGSGLAHLAGTGVTYLNLDGCDNLAEVELAHLKGLPKLGQLTLIISPITDAGLKHVAAVKGLTYVQLCRCSNVTDAGIKHFEGMPGLLGLELDTTGITPAALQSVAKMKSLTGFKGFSGEPGNATLTDADLKPLVGAAALEQFNVNLSAVTDAGLDTLAQIKTLKALNLKGSKVTAAGVKKFKAVLPECKVTSDFE